MVAVLNLAPEDIEGAEKSGDGRLAICRCGMRLLRRRLGQDSMVGWADGDCMVAGCGSVNRGRRLMRRSGQGSLIGGAFAFGWFGGQGITFDSIPTAFAISEKCASNNSNSTANSQKTFNALPLLNAIYTAVDKPKRQCKSDQQRQYVSNEKEYLTARFCIGPMPTLLHRLGNDSFPRFRVVLVQYIWWRERT